MKKTNDLEEKLLKKTILSKNGTFKTAFQATLGFYAGQFVAQLVGLVLFFTTVAVTGLLVYAIFKSLN